MVGAFIVLETEMDSRLLWPGTPSNVFACASFSAAFALSSSAAFAFTCATVMMGFGRTGRDGVAPEMRSAAARVMRGDMDGGAVDATGMVSVRLCPGTLANIFLRVSLEGVVRGELYSREILGGVTPARRSAARVVRGTIVGETCEGGISRALKGTREPFELVPLVMDELPAGEYPFVLDTWRIEDRREDERDRREPVVRARSSVERSEGRSEVGKGGEEAKSELIWISAVSASGEPRTAFCSLEIP